MMRSDDGDGNEARPVTLARRSGVWLPWGLVLLAALMSAADIVVSVQNDEAAHRHVELEEWLLRAANGVQPITFSVVGAFILTRRPGNRIGWIMVAIGVTAALSNLMSDYPAGGNGSARLFRTLSAWVSTWDWTLPFLALLLLFLMFPTGELPASRWKALLWAGVASLSGVSVLNAVRIGSIGDVGVANPLGLLPVPDIVIGLVGTFALLALACALLALLLRFRSAQGNVRQQLKCFTYGAALTITFQLAAFVTGWTQEFIALLAQSAGAALPVFIGVAILRYRLYDIDILINRTLVYGSLTVTLAGLYLGGVLGLQALFRAVTGQGSNLAVAITTLTVAALFNPWRHRIQVFIDRQFYRRKYNASLALTTLQGQLRDEVDVDHLSAKLVTTVEETVQPSYVSLWLR